MVSDHLRIVQNFSEEIEDHKAWPRPHCPTCRKGYVSWDKPTTNDNSVSRKNRSHEAWEPEWMSGTMHATGHCENGACEEIITAVGTFRVDLARDRPFDGPYEEYRGPEYSEFFKFQYFNPPLVLLTLSESVPQNVRAAIDRAAAIIFVDPSLAATALRGSVERFLTGEGIPVQNTKGFHTSLDKRIQAWDEATMNRQVADLLRAVKWIGNDGTHEGEPLTVEDVLHGLEFIELAFHELYVAPGIATRMNAVNRAKGRYIAEGLTAS